MKKFLLVLAIGAFVACNDAPETTETETEVTVDTTTAPVIVDSSAVVVDSSAVVDSTK